MVNFRACWRLTRTEPCCTTFTSTEKERKKERKKMEHVALNDVQLDYLARDDPQLKPVFYGTVACDRLLKSPRKNTPQGYIVNTDPHDQPGQHWLAVWTDHNVCEVLDSYALPLER